MKHINQLIPCLRPMPKSNSVLVCFPHAGGSAGFFSPWGGNLPTDIELNAVNYPGRAGLSNEVIPVSLDKLIRLVAGSLLSFGDRRLVLFGHSLGALVAYEVTRHLHTQYDIQPFHLIVSGRRAPSDSYGGSVHKLPDDQLIEEIVNLGGTSSQLFSNPEAKEIFLPTVRNDYRLSETYRYHPGIEPQCPVTAICGTSDPEVTPSQAAVWAKHTTSNFTLETISGGHFYLLQERQALLTVLAKIFQKQVSP